ncbi:MAG: TOBE domain-containing protein, partial [Jiangellaceae bacterium]
TMADTIAVMNAGRVEQMGSPTQLYDHPATTFVANFLGQSNLLRAAAAPSGDDVVLTAQGRRWTVPAERCRATGADVWMGVRPEKLRLRLAGVATPAGHNSVDGVVTDTSFIGVSTQYLVRTPWDQEVVVFEQNVGIEGPIEPGAGVTVHWEPAHAFVLDVSPADLAAAALPGTEVEGPVVAPT